MASEKQVAFIQKLTPKLLAEKPDVAKATTQGDEKYTRFYMRNHIGNDTSIEVEANNPALLEQRAAEYDAAVMALRNADLAALTSQQASAIIDALKNRRLQDAAKVLTQ